MKIGEQQSEVSIFNPVYLNFEAIYHEYISNLSSSKETDIQVFIFNPITQDKDADFSG